MSSKVSWSTGSRSLANPNFQDPDFRIGVELKIVTHPVFMPETIPCSLCSEDLFLIRIQYGMLLEYELELPRSSDRACAPFLDRFCLYTKVLRVGLRLPILSFVIAFFYDF